MNHNKEPALSAGPVDHASAARALTAQQLLELALEKLRAESSNEPVTVSRVSFSVPLVSGARS